MKVYIYKIC